LFLLKRGIKEREGNATVGPGLGFINKKSFFHVGVVYSLFLLRLAFI